MITSHLPVMHGCRATMARSQPSQGTNVVHLSFAPGSVRDVVQLDLCVSLPLPARLSRKQQQQLQLKMDQVVQANRGPEELYGSVRVIYGKPKSAQQRVATGFTVQMAAPQATVTRLYNRLSTALTFCMGEGEEALQLGVKPVKGHIPVMITAGMPLAVSPKAVEAAIKHASGSSGVSVLANSVRWGPSVSGCGTSNDCMFAVLTCTEGTPVPECFSFPVPGGGVHSARVHVLPGAIPCMPMPLSMRQALQRDQQRSAQQPAATPATAARPASYAAAAAATPPAWHANPLAHTSGGDSRHSRRSSSSSGSSSSMGASASHSLETPQPAVVPTAHTSSVPSTAAGHEASMMPQASASSPAGVQPAGTSQPQDQGEGEGFQPVISKRQAKRAALARATAESVEAAQPVVDPTVAASAAAAAALSFPAPALGRRGAVNGSGSSRPPPPGVGRGVARGTRPRPLKAEGATPSPDAKIAKT